MKLLDILFESADLDNHRDRFVKRFKTIMGAKTRTTRLEYTEKLISSLLKKEEIRFLVLQLQRKK